MIDEVPGYRIPERAAMAKSSGDRRPTAVAFDRVVALKVLSVDAVDGRHDAPVRA